MSAPSPWDSAQPVDAARAAALVRAQFPDLRDAPVRPIATGWDNSVVVVGDVLFRFPRREIALDGQRRELAVLPLLSDLPLAVPRPTHLGNPAGDYPWPFWGGPMLPGDELADRPAADRTSAAAATGTFLRALHDVCADVELPVDPMSRADPSACVAKARNWLDRLTARGLWSGSAAVEALLSAPVPPGHGRVLVHGDLHLRHLLVDDAGRATGVIDWGDTCWADPSVDLSLAWSAFEGRSRRALLDAYGPVDRDQELRARVLAVFLCAALAESAAATGHAALAKESLAGLRRAAD